jgi:hypothetical protein
MWYDSDILQFLSFNVQNYERWRFPHFKQENEIIMKLK